MELIVSCPSYCPNKNIHHETDDLKELHGSLDKPIPVPEMREERYVAWEYDEIGRQVVPFNKCFQQLFQGEGKAADRVVVRDIAGRHHVFYFDISAQMKARNESYEQAWKDHQAGKPIDPKTKAMFEKALEIQKQDSRIVRL